MSSLSRLVHRFIRGNPRRKSALDSLADSSLTFVRGIHVGAHQGQELDFYERIGFKEMLWVEASPDQFAILQGHLATSTRLKNVAVNAFASESDGEVAKLRQFNNDGASSSVFAATLLLKETWPGLDETGRIEEVTTATLDRIAAETGFLAADFLNLDVQGAELLVLKGATSILGNVRAIITEVSTKPYYDGGVLWPELRDFLRSHGFKEKHNDPRPHGDMLFLRG